MIKTSRLPIFFIILASLFHPTNKVEAYFETKAANEIKLTVGDWAAPVIQFSTNMNEEKYQLNEYIKNGDFSNGLTNWQVAGDVKVDDETSSDSKNVILSATKDTPASIKQIIKPNKEKVLFFELKNTAQNEKVIQEHSFQVRVNNVVVYDWSGDNSTNTKEKTFITLPKANEPIEIMFQVKPIFAGLTETFELSTITTQALVLDPSDKLIVNSLEEAEVCFTNQKKGKDCHRNNLVIDIQNPVETVTISATDMSAFETRKTMYLKKIDMKKMNPKEIMVYSEKNNYLTLHLQDLGEVTEPSYVKVSVAQEKDGQYVFVDKPIFNWFDFAVPNPQLLSYTKEMIKVAESAIENPKWAKVSFCRSVGSCYELEPVAIIHN